MLKEISLTSQTRSVIAAFIERHGNGVSGAEIGRKTGLASGSLYPILARLEKAGWLTSEWETEEPSALGRPRRRLYKLTSEGIRCISRIAREITPAKGGLAWAQ
ncbi:helix-turn-helix transcriptional regulator [Rhizobium sp. TH2]|nr:helix-turn-helix transcriptional regulator [Rhizobium sp. TH2]